ncbi:MAG: hypothetical protein EXR74_03575 [Bdellovibrionales bacterium]|nr:hypothetical protein [Bdellovibrionales bacterium]
MKPTLTSFWIEPCGYSDRVLKILNEIKALYPPDALDIVAFYANPIENGLLETIKKQKGLTYRLASLQQSIDIQQGLTKSFHGARMGGDIFLVNSKGEVTHVDAMKSGKTSADIKSEVLAALSRNVPSLRAITAEKQ